MSPSQRFAWNSSSTSPSLSTTRSRATRRGVTERDLQKSSWESLSQTVHRSPPPERRPNVERESLVFEQLELAVDAVG